jgi:hypothetical protein
VIDPIEALIKLARDDAGLRDVVDDRIAGEQRFGKGSGRWSIDEPALALGWDGGTAEMYVEVQTPRVEARCYGKSFAEAAKVYAALVEFCRPLNRELVETSSGLGLVYYANITTSPGRLIDPDVDVPLLLCFIEAAVAETTAAA